MQIDVSRQARSAIVAAGLAFAGALTGSAEASVITASPSLPLIGVPYISPGGAGCFSIASVCVTPGPFVQTKTVLSTISGGSQNIEAKASYDGTLSGAYSGSVSLTGTVDYTVVGRTSLSELGTFPTDITGLSLTGTLDLPGSPFDNHALDVTLAAPSFGMTTIAQDGGLFRIDSFFDVFIEISLPGTGLSAFPPVIRLVAVPEPSTWAMMLVGFAGLGVAARRRAAVSASV
jgi:hypothetical protein